HLVEALVTLGSPDGNTPTVGSSITVTPAATTRYILYSTKLWPVPPPRKRSRPQPRDHGSEETHNVRTHPEQHISVRRGGEARLDGGIAARNRRPARPRAVTVDGRVLDQLTIRLVQIHYHCFAGCEPG